MQRNEHDDKGDHTAWGTTKQETVKDRELCIRFDVCR